MANRVLQLKSEKAASFRMLTKNQAASAAPLPPRAERKKQRLNQQALYVAASLGDNRQVVKAPAPSIDQSTPAGQFPIVPTPATPQPLETVPPSLSQ